MAFYRGKRVSEYRKELYATSSGPLTGPSAKIYVIDNLAGYVRYIKNIRGMIGIAANESTPYNNWINGYLCLVRYPRLEVLSVGDILIDASHVLHPVPFAMQGQPLTLYYEFKGITLGNEEVLYFAIVPSLSAGGNAACVSIMFNRKVEAVPA